MDGFSSSTPSVRHQQVVVGKVLSAVILLYLLVIMVRCPCSVLYSCHLDEIYTSLAALLLVIVFFNGTHLRSYTP